MDASRIEVPLVKTSTAAYSFDASHSGIYRVLITIENETVSGRKVIVH
jgi:hypothetical protein